MGLNHREEEERRRNGAPGTPGRAQQATIDSIRQKRKRQPSGNAILSGAPQAANGLDSLQQGRRPTSKRGLDRVSKAADEPRAKRRRDDTIQYSGTENQGSILTPNGGRECEPSFSRNELLFSVEQTEEFDGNLWLKPEYLHD